MPRKMPARKKAATPAKRPAAPRKAATPAKRPAAPKRPARAVRWTPDRVAELIGRLKMQYPEARCSLDHRSPLQLLLATILSAQCTDERVNKVTPGLFERYPDAGAFAGAPLADLEQAVKSTGFYRAKARSIQECCRDLVSKHGGRVPAEMGALTALRGVGRKTANVVLGNAFGIPGVVVDTHVGRLSRRLGLTREEDPVKVETDLMAALPREDWTLFSHLLIHHGRAICLARKPHCSRCPLAELCPRVEVTASD